MINPACDACSGACCESLVMALPADPEVAVWLTLKGRVEGTDVRIPAPCQALDHGRCGIHQMRPLLCRVFLVGGPQCVKSIRANRPKDAARLIRLARQNQET